MMANPYVFITIVTFYLVIMTAFPIHLHFDLTFMTFQLILLTNSFVIFHFYLLFPHILSKIVDFLSHSQDFFLDSELSLLSYL